MNTVRSILLKTFPFFLLLILSVCSEPEVPKPEITDVAPAEGSIGTQVVITGKNFAAVKSILFGTTATFAVSSSATQIITVVPDGLIPGGASINVMTEGGKSNGFPFIILPSEPEITSIEPDKGAIGMEISIKGKNLANVSSALFGTKTVNTFSFKSQTEVRLVVPDGLEPGALDVSITNEAGTSPNVTFTVVAKPVISSFSPASGPVGKVVSITGLNFDEPVKVHFGTVEAMFEPKSATLIDATVPAAAITSKIKVVTAGGEALSATDFVVKDGPAINTFTPTSGIVGTVVTITGGGFETVGTTVKFGAVKATEVTIVSPTQLTAKVPPTATTGKITVQTSVESALSGTDFTVIGPPTIASFTPTSGGTNVQITITGTNFISITELKFNNTVVVPANYTVVSPTTIMVKVPAGATTGKISIKTAAGTVISTNNFTIVPAPTITSFTPNLGPAGLKVSITGTNFSGVTKVFFGTGEAAFDFKSATLIEATVPTSASTGKIKVVTPGGEALSATDFTVKGAPEITGFTPVSGLVGATVTISGKNFDAGSVKVKFGSGQATDVTVVSATQITAKVPALGTSGKITVETAAGAVLSANSFTVIGSPTVTAFTPAGGVIGIDVVVTGTNFISVTEVRINNILITTGNYTIVSPTQIKIKVPAGVSTGKISITTLAGTGNSDANFLVYLPPTITSFTPTIGPAGREVIVSGTNFTGATKLWFGATESALTVQSAGSIRTTVPVGAITGKIKIQTPGGEATSADNFVVKGAPEITNFTPSSGIVGATITISGQNFDAGAVVVKFGTGTATDVAVVNANQITAKVPATATTGKITVETAAGAVLSANTFTVIGAPTITSFTPTSAGSGTEVTVTGANFINVTSIKINGVSVPTGNYTIVSATQIEVTIPVGTATGKIAVTTPAGTATSATDFTMLAAPTITAFTPGNSSPGNNVVITGTGFAGITGVRFNGVDVGAGNYTVNSSTQITARIPSNATSGKITVTNGQGTATSVNNFYVTPFISTVAPTSAASGTAITLTGTNLDGASVRFNSTAVTPSANSGTSITVTVPTGISGAVNITVVNLGGTSNSKTFTIASSVILDEIVATANSVDQLLLLKGSNLQGATKVMFGTVQASIFTNTQKVVTTKIPTSLAPGNYTVTLVTGNGTSNGKNLEVLSAPNPSSGDVSTVIGATVSGVPASTPPVSNQWSNDFNSDEKFLISGTDHSVVFSVNGTQIATGTVIFDQANNYIEFTLQGIRYVGVWRPSTNEIDPGDGLFHCYAHMTLISAASGRQLELTVQANYDPCP